MPKTLIDTVVKELKQERARLENELHRVTAAITTFGSVFMNGNKRAPAARRKKRIISAAGRRKIAAAQRARWAKVRAAKKGS
jgi:16S rRNA G1207 methylase RsmC